MQYLKSNVGILVIGFLVTLLLSPAFTREGDRDARGRIDRVKNGYFEVIVEGKTVDGPLWLGCTLFPGSEREMDLEAVESSGRCFILCSGKFKKRFKVPGFGSRLYDIAKQGSDALDVPYVVALWRWKVEHSECNNGKNGGSCNWCRKNGYHLEDRVDIGRGTWSFDDEGADRSDLRKGQANEERREAKKRADQHNRRKATSFNGITLNDIMSVSLADRKINGSNNSSNQIVTGTILVYQTNRGRYGKLQIQDYDRNITIKWTTYSASGKIYSQGRDLIIRGTWTCDLDAGEESGDSAADFWWEQVTSRKRYMVPRNGAKFAIW